ncbi:MAG: FAD-dependent oxidoreductase [Candidatus Omnitrophota bacterium]
MKKILIIGAGFGGLTAVSSLSAYKPKLDITLIDKKQTSDFLPNLPDCIGRGINPEFLSFDLSSYSKKRGVQFLKEEVLTVNPVKKEAVTATKTLAYDYLIIASGAETNFYGNENIKKNAYKLYSVDDAKEINRCLKTGDFQNCIVSGGGYTGIEAATNLRLYFNRRSLNKRIIIAERAGSILGPLPEWMKQYTNNNLKKLGIELLLNTSVERIEAGSIHLSSGEVFDKTMLIWAAGVRTADFISNMPIEKDKQGRIKVDEYLRLDESCFVIGDAASFSYKNVTLRMAVQFAIFQARSACRNIIRAIQGKKLKKYFPVDLGYIIPMANNRSCGAVLGVNFTGALATFLHFTMCVYRSWSVRNKLGIIGGLLKGGG